MYFNVIRNIISDDNHYIFTTGETVIYSGFELPEWLDELFILDIAGTEDSYGEGLIFKCVC